MWLDNASEVDMLFYKPYSDVITEIIENEKYSPLTIGIFGLWGAGKSTLLNLIKNSVDEKNATCIEINAWNYEGYEDAKISIMESIINTLEENETLIDKAKDNIDGLKKRINWLKIGKKLLHYGPSLAMVGATGNPVPLLLNLANDVLTDKEKMTKAIDNTISGLEDFNDNYMKEKQNSTVENIRQFRSEFSEMLEKTKIKNLVVLIDDLDRCTPDRIIETLEAIKLFLSVDKTTFIIAADENVIQYAIKNKYPQKQENDPDISKEYIEKVIQLPIYIPELSSKDIENYLMILMTQKYIEPEKFNTFLDKINSEKLLVSDQKITLEKMNEITSTLKDAFIDEDEYKENIEIIAKIKGIISTVLKGNPRQAKRFLNTFIVKKKLAEKYYGNELNIEILAKLLVLQKINSELFIELNNWNKEFSTKNERFEELINAYQEGNMEKDFAEWNTEQVKKWIACEPKNIQNERLDKYFYLTRELLDSSIIENNNLSIKSRKILKDIGSAEPHNISSILDEMLKCSTEIKNEIFSVILPRIKQGKEEMFIIGYMYITFEEYKNAIIDNIINGSYIFNLPDATYWKMMRSNNAQDIDKALNELKEKSKINEKQIDYIKGE